MQQSAPAAVVATLRCLMPAAAAVFITALVLWLRSMTIEAHIVWCVCMQAVVTAEPDSWSCKPFKLTHAGGRGGAMSCKL